MAISPNNGAFLLNLNFPLVNFVVTTLHQRDGDGLLILSFFNVTFVNEDIAIQQALDSEFLMSNIAAANKNTCEELIYLKALKEGLEITISKLDDNAITDILLGKENSTKLFHRRVWLSLGMP